MSAIEELSAYRSQISEALQDSGDTANTLQSLTSDTETDGDFLTTLNAQIGEDTTVSSMVTADGVLSADDLGISSDFLGKFDIDGDGGLSSSEISAAMKQFETSSATTTSYSNFYEGLSAMAGDLFKSLDTNADDKLSAEEMGVTAAEFAALDANGDGVLDLDEVDAALMKLQDVEVDGETVYGDSYDQQVAAIVADFMSKEDDNGDGLISMEEGEATAEEMACVDQNGDGYADADELAAAFVEFDENRNLIVDTKEGEAIAENSGEDELPEGYEEKVDEVVVNYIDLHDTNADSVLSAEEIGVTAEELGKIDTNGDGVVDADELFAAYLIMDKNRNLVLDANEIAVTEEA